ncbi:MAG TPA: M48 family metalloprotease [Terriglobales bacterium]|jgi:predicted Zn-dependent protease
MRRWLGLSVMLLMGIAVVVKSERSKVDVAASPNAVLYFVADTERELTRMPMQLTRLPDAEEVRIGNQLAAGYAISSGPGVVQMQGYVQQVGAGLAAHARRKLPYRFHYVADDNFVNAFALPGGHVFIGKGLMALMDSEDQLAAVLGHEIEHIDHYHCAERVQQEEILRKVPMGEMVEIPIEVFEAGYTKDQELEADREGARLAVASGYSASGAIRLFQKLQSMERQYQKHADNPAEEASQVAWQTVEGYFRSHPLPEERIAQLREMHLEIHQERKLQ